MRYIRLSAVLLLAACGDGEPTAPPTPVATSITLSATSLSFASLGETSQLSATVKDQDGATMSGASVTWASTAEGVATVSAAGLVTSVGDGTTTIMAVSGSVNTTATVTVSQVQSSIELSPTTLSFESLGATATLVATVKDALGSTIPGVTVTWLSSATDVATVSSGGLVTSVGDGTSTIIASSGSMSATATVTVTHPSTIELSPSTITLSSVGDTVTVGATVKDVGGNVLSDAAVSWSSSDTTVATISATGLVTAVANGTATITATSGSGSATAPVTVAQVASSITLSSTSITLSPAGATATLTPTVRDAGGTVILGATVTWSSSNTAVATVSDAGVVTAVADGTAVITATSGSATATATVTVQIPSSITLSPTNLSFASFADTATLTPTVKDSGGATIVGAAVTWSSSDESIATVSSAGLVTAIANGTATITATSGSVSKTATATVSQVVSSMTLSTDSVSFSSFSDTATVTVTLKDANDSTMAGATVTWSSSNTSIATVSSAGLITSVADGTATITATSDSKTATATVTIKRWASISSGYRHTCAVTVDGLGYCWGSNQTWVRLGNGTGGSSDFPVLVSGEHTWKSIIVGLNHTCGVTTADAGYCWGWNGSGRLGDGTTTNRTVPTLVSGGHAWDVIHAGRHGSCGLTTAGAAYCWGGVNLGNGTSDSSDVPVLVSGGHTWKSIVVPNHDWAQGYACGLTTAGAAYCWGDGSFRGNGTGGNSDVPVLVSGGHTWKSIGAGRDHVCAVTTADAAYCWGNNGYAQFGNGETGGNGLPTTLVSGGHAWESIGGGYGFSCGVTTANAGYCWGYRFHYEGPSTNPDLRQLTPGAISGGHAWESISAGNWLACGITTAGVAYCWGGAGTGALGGAPAGSTPGKIALPW